MNRLHMNSALLQKNSISFALTATFTAEPIDQAFRFWLNVLGQSYGLSFAPYNQVFQQLLDPNSLFSLNTPTDNQGACNIILIRLEDWPLEALGKNAADFTEALTSFARQNRAPILVCFCHASPSNYVQKDVDDQYRLTEESISASLKDVSNIEVITRQDIFSLYPVENYYDPVTEKTGHIPYTAPYFTALASIIVRRYFAIVRPPYKVIVLDCDNTLWDGVCGEEGLNVRVTEAHIWLQRFMLAQRDQGMLLCLGSKNVESDVFMIFDEHPDMVLKRSDLVAWKINWEPKSQNILELAEELQLGVDSFIFVDDNPIEQAEVAAHIPQVQTLLVPKDNTIPRFLQHAWVFDKSVVTEEDKFRSQRYQENVQREHLKASTSSLRDFLINLNLEIAIAQPAPSDFPRLAQLTQRTNQFNATTIRRSEGELNELLASDTLQALKVHLKDRFGDYGIVGMALFQQKDGAVQLDTFILSCRALGRGVEHALVRHIALLAHEAGCTFVDIAFSTTPKNKPIASFLEDLQPETKTTTPSGTIYRYPVDALAQLDPLDAATPSRAVTKKKKSNGAVASVAHGIAPYQHIATSLHDVHHVNRLVHEARLDRPALQAEYTPPISRLEKEITTIWKDVLHIRDIGLDDGFKELGGSSLHLVQIHSKLHSTLRKELPLTTLFGLPTIRSLINHLEKTQFAHTDGSAIQQRAARQKAAMSRLKELRNNRK